MIRTKNVRTFVTVAVVCLCMSGVTAFAEHEKDSTDCKSLPSYGALKSALDAAVQTETSGLNFNMWATLVNRDGIVCAVAFSGVDRGAQWPGSRVISAQKANTANSFSLDSSSNSNLSGPGTPPLNSPGGLALSTANLYSAVQPGGSLFGLQFSNPVETDNAYDGPSLNFGKQNDPMVGGKIGGVNVFGGGLGLYAAGKKIVGGLGVSGDTSCADHQIAWRVRHTLGLDHMLAGPSGAPAVGGVAADPNHPDNIIYDIVPNPNGGTGNSAGGFGHPRCINTGDQTLLPNVVQ